MGSGEWEQWGQDVYAAAVAEVGRIETGASARPVVSAALAHKGQLSEEALRAAIVGYLLAHLDAGGRVG
ncbi:MAG: hypothetical protein Q8S73_03575 [Deltaproteobacteria bacterium]|nr:hypothetical protein [Myxococcales bacterium]MDP3213159.1 hypothetical protein [Deltaproteobacteria bacterium]